MRNKILNLQSLSIFAHRCKCGELNVHGGWQQLDKTWEKELNRVIVHMPCEACGWIWNRGYKLTSRNPYPRLINWTMVGFRLFVLLRYLPGGWFPFLSKWAMRFVFWAERRLVI